MTLELNDINTYYGGSHILHNLSLKVGEGEVTSLLGRNGAGKTTTMRTIMGLTPPRTGSIVFREEEIAGLPPHEIFRRGISLVPQGRRIFPALTVEENLRLAIIKGGELENAYERFPILKERRRQRAGHLSGGERQMLAIARALVGRPRLILFDEPTEGLAPIVVREIRGIITGIRGEGIAILLAEQNVKMALALADRHYIIDKGEVKFQGSRKELEEKGEVLETYLGVSIRAY